MKKFILAFVIIVITISCKNDSSHIDSSPVITTQTLSMKVNGVYKQFNDFNVTSGEYYEGHRYIIDGIYVNRTSIYDEGIVLELFRDVQIAQELTIRYNILENSEWRGYHEENGHPLTYGIEINSPTRLKGTFSGVLIGNEVEPITIIEGKFDISHLE